MVAVLVGVREADLLGSRAFQQHLALLGGELGPGLSHVDLEMAADRLQELRIKEVRATPGRDRALGQRERRVGHDQVGIRHQPGPDAGAGGAGAVRRVERKVARLGLGHRRPVVGAGVVLAHLDLVTARRPPLRRKQDRALTQPQGGLE